MKNVCSSSGKHTINVINFVKKKMLPLRKRNLNLHQDVIECYICGKTFLSLLMIKIIENLETIVMLQVNTELQRIVHVV